MIESVKPLESIGTYEKRITVQLKGCETRRVPASGPGVSGFRTERGEAWERNGVLEIEIDIPAIIRDLGKKAFSNKTGKARDGHVLVRRV